MKKAKDRGELLHHGYLCSQVETPEGIVKVGDLITLPVDDFEPQIPYQVTAIIPGDMKDLHFLEILNFFSVRPNQVTGII